MAVLTGQDFVKYFRRLHSDPEAYATLKAEGISRQQLQAAMQAIEDRWEADRSGYKADADAAAGVTLTVMMAKKLAKAWMENKWGGE